MKTFLLHRLWMLIFLLAGTGQLFAQRKTDPMISLKGSSITVSQFIQQVKAQQSLQFTFDEDVNASLNKTIQVRKNTVLLSEALDWLALDAAIKYRLINNYIILSKSVAPQKSLATPFIADTVQPAKKALSEVVVTALGLKKTERNLGYSVAQLSSKDISDVPQPNVLNSLTGRVPGVNVRSTGSDPGSSVMVTIRGQSSLSKDNQPLYVIDGVPVAPAISNPAQAIDGKQTIDYGSPISDISADDIASITVLKGASAAALYGSRAGSGVILITTKSGNAKKGLGVSFNSTAMFDKAWMFPHFQNEYGSGDRVGSDNTISTGAWGPKLNTARKLVQWNSPVDADGNKVPLDWVAYPDRIKDFFRTGQTYTNNVAVSKSGMQVTSDYPMPICKTRGSYLTRISNVIT